jgi:hypothetical protein
VLRDCRSDFPTQGTVAVIGELSHGIGEVRFYLGADMDEVFSVVWVHALLFGYRSARTPDLTGSERKIAAELPRPPITPNPAHVCEGCGWTSYPQPVTNGSPLHIDWRVTATCSGCGARLERHTGMTKAAGPSA